MMIGWEIRIGRGHESVSIPGNSRPESKMFQDSLVDGINLEKNETTYKE
jgi:hypothetical protein